MEHSRHEQEPGVAQRVSCTYELKYPLVRNHLPEAASIEYPSHMSSKNGSSDTKPLNQAVDPAVAKVLPPKDLLGSSVTGPDQPLNSLASYGHPSTRSRTVNACSTLIFIRYWSQQGEKRSHLTGDHVNLGFDRVSNRSTAQTASHLRPDPLNFPSRFS